MERKKLWTKEEDEILLKAIEESPYNKSGAFREASKKLNRTTIACQGRWYDTLSNPKSAGYRGVQFTLIGVKSRVNNRVISRKNSKTHVQKNINNIWNKFLELIKFT